MFYLTNSQNIDLGMLRSAQPSQNIDILGLAIQFLNFFSILYKRPNKVGDHIM